MFYKIVFRCFVLKGLLKKLEANKWQNKNFAFPIFFLLEDRVLKLRNNQNVYFSNILSHFTFIFESLILVAFKRVVWKHFAPVLETKWLF